MTQQRVDIMTALAKPVLVETIDNINIYFEPLLEHCSPYDLFESEDAKETIEKVESGEWVYFVAKVTAKIDGENDEPYNLELASNYLGNCVYESYEDFYKKYKDDYYSDMRNEVLEEAKKELKALKKVIDKIIN